VNEYLLTALKLGAVVVLVLLNGFFVAAEFALVSVRRTRIEELVEHGNAMARSVQRATRDLGRYIAGVQLGVTMASLALGSVGERTVGGLIERAIGEVPAGGTIAVVIAFATVTAFTIIFGELVPKSIAYQRAERTALLLTGPLQVFVFIFRPFIWFLNASGRLVVRLTGLEAADEREMVHSPEELRMLVEASGKAGALDEVERGLLTRAFILGELHAHEVMLPRTEMEAIPITATGRELLRQAEEIGFSRYPVYEGTLDNIKGIVHVKDVLSAALDGELDTIHMPDVMREPLFLPDTKPADELLDEMRARGVHMACVVDEFGGVAGIVTFERVLERLVGAMRDEFEATEEPPIAPQPDGSYLIDGLVLITELNERLDLGLDDSEFDTIGGLTFGLLGHRPVVGEVAQTRGVRLEVVELDGLRVARVRLTRLQPELDTAAPVTSSPGTGE
jgi:CBS domain containing-hemolysin-like protein